MITIKKEGFFNQSIESILINPKLDNKCHLAVGNKVENNVGVIIIHELKLPISPKEAKIKKSVKFKDLKEKPKIEIYFPEITHIDFLIGQLQHLKMQMKLCKNFENQ